MLPGLHLVLSLPSGLVSAKGPKRTGYCKLEVWPEAATAQEGVGEAPDGCTLSPGFT